MTYVCVIPRKNIGRPWNIPRNTHKLGWWYSIRYSFVWPKIILFYSVFLRKRKRWLYSAGILRHHGIRICFCSSLFCLQMMVVNTFYIWYLCGLHLIFVWSFTALMEGEDPLLQIDEGGATYCRRRRGGRTRPYSWDSDCRWEWSNRKCWCDCKEEGLGATWGNWLS